METKNEKILQTPIDHLGLHGECVENLKLLGVFSLQEFVDMGWKNLREKDGFNYVWFNRVINFLDQKELLHLLEKGH